MVIKNNRSLFFLLIFNLIFFKVVKLMIKNGIKINDCFTKKTAGLTKWLMRLDSDKPDLFKP